MDPINDPILQCDPSGSTSERMLLCVLAFLLKIPTMMRLVMTMAPIKERDCSDCDRMSPVRVVFWWEKKRKFPKTTPSH